MTAPRVVFIASQRYRGHHYGRNHPLGIPRVALTHDLICSYRNLKPHFYLEARPATSEQLQWFHSPEYIEALHLSQKQGKISGRFRKQHNFGNFENPWFEGIFDIPALAAGASIQGAEQVIAGRMAFNPAGGMHHAAPNRAKGFCFLNDAVLGIHRLCRNGWRILYFDMDAHYGDGVAHGLSTRKDVLVVSFHMDTQYAYPLKGGDVNDIGPSANRVNLPLPRNTNDSEYRAAFSAVWPRLLAAFSPDAVVLQAGTDILTADPLGKFTISNGCFWEIIDIIQKTAPSHPDGTPRLLVIGGGGYHPIILARCWTGLWGRLARWHLPDAIPSDGVRLLSQVATQWDDDDMDPENPMFHRLQDAPQKGPVRPVVKAAIHELLTSHPLFGNGPDPVLDGH